MELMTAAGLVRRVGHEPESGGGEAECDGAAGEDLLPAAQFCVRVIRRLDEAAEQVRRRCSVTERECSGDRESAPRHERRGGCCTTCTGRGRRMSTPIRTWSPGSVIRRSWSRNAARTGHGTSGGWPGCWSSRWPRWPGPGYDKPVWHCAVRAAPGDRMLSDAEWAQVAARVMHRTGLAPAGDELGVRWVAVRHAADHIHLVATLARQDGTRPRIWNDFYRVREACQDAEQRFGLRCTAPADRTAARRPSRAETEQAARRGWAEPPRVRLRREVCTAAAGAATGAGVLRPAAARPGCWSASGTAPPNPGQVTGYAVGLPGHDAADGGVIWYGGGKLAADLTLPKLRRRWTAPGSGILPRPRSTGLPPAAVARRCCGPWSPGRRTRPRDEAGFFAALREAGRWCGCGSATSIRDRSPGTPSPCPGTPARTGRRSGTAAGGWLRR